MNQVIVDAIIDRQSLNITHSSKLQQVITNFEDCKLLEIYGSLRVKGIMTPDPLSHFQRQYDTWSYKQQERVMELCYKRT